MVRAATASPSTTWYGLARSRARSLKLAGSPSAALHTTYRWVPGDDRTPDHFLAVGKPAPPRPRSPAVPSSSIVSSGPSRRAISSACPPPIPCHSATEVTGCSGSR